MSCAGCIKRQLFAGSRCSALRQTMLPSKTVLWGQPGMGSRAVSPVKAAFCFPVPLLVTQVWVRSRPLPLDFDKSGDAAAPLENTFLPEPFSWEVMPLSCLLALVVLPPALTPTNPCEWRESARLPPTRPPDPDTQSCFSTTERSHPVRQRGTVQGGPRRTAA